MKLLSADFDKSLWLDDLNVLIVRAPISNVCWATPFLVNIFYECGYKYVDEHNSGILAFKFAGKPLDELKKELRKRADHNKKERHKRKEEHIYWQNQHEIIKNYLIGIDKTIYDFETGFNVYVLTNIKHTKKEQINFVKNHKKLFINFVVKEIKKLRRGKYADLLPFCYISEITVKNNNEIVVTFEIKEELQEKLQSLN